MQIRLTDYARIHGKDPGNLRRMAESGRFESAEKRGKLWYIDSDEPYPTDGRVTTGDYRNWRKDKESE